MATDLSAFFAPDVNHLKRRGAIKILERLLSNLVTDPGNPKYHRVRLNNKKIAASIVRCPHALDVLLAAGFERGGTPDDPVLVIPEPRSEEETAMIADTAAQVLVEMSEGQERAEERHRTQWRDSLHTDEIEHDRQVIVERIEATKKENKDRPPPPADALRRTGPAPHTTAHMTTFADIGVDLNQPKSR